MDKLYIWGAGIVGKELQTILSLFGCFEGFIDNDAAKQAHGWNDARVYSLDQYLALQAGGVILVAVSDKNVKPICEQLEKAGLVENKDYYLADHYINDVFPMKVYESIKELMIPLVQISVTERCALKCEKCAHACYNVPMNQEDLSMEDVMESADCFFERVDKAGEFVLIGGEPFLYREIGQAISYIGERYRARIGIFSITTNGTIIPSEDVLEACRKNRILVRISNYAKANPKLKERYKALCDQLDEHSVDYVLGEEEHRWIDYGFGMVDRGEAADLVKVFAECRTPCREVRKNRFYYCVMARSVSDNLGLDVGEEDYLDLSAAKDKQEILDYQMGKIPKGYLEMCRFCRGKDAEKFPIPAAEQVKK